MTFQYFLRFLTKRVWQRTTRTFGFTLPCFIYWHWTNGVYYPEFIKHGFRDPWKKRSGEKWLHLIVMLIRRDTCTTKAEMFLLATIIFYRLESWIWSNFEVTFINTDPDGSMFYCHHFPFNVFFCWFTFPLCIWNMPFVISDKCILSGHCGHMGQQFKGICHVPLLGYNLWQIE